MTTPNPLTLASAAQIKELIEAGTVTHDAAIARVDEVLKRTSIKEGKAKRWLRLRDWIVTHKTETVEPA